MVHYGKINVIEWRENPTGSSQLVQKKKKKKAPDKFNTHFCQKRPPGAGVEANQWSWDRVHTKNSVHS
jgi:hypothetical protein